MNIAWVVAFVCLAAVVVWWSRHVPLDGWRKWVSIGCRLAAIGCVCAALTGTSIRRPEVLPRYVIYLVDASASLDAAQRAWMASRIASLEARRPPEMGRAVVVFGAEARAVLQFGHEALTEPDVIRRAIELAKVTPDQTNLETGLLSSVAVLPSQHRGSVVLLSDGRETAGNATGILGSVRGLGLKVFPTVVPAFGEVKTAWETLAVPPVVQRGSPVPVQLVVFNGTPRVKRGRVTVGLEGVPIKQQRILVQPGWQVATVSVPSISRGTMALEVQLAIPDEQLSERRRAYVEIEGPPQILVVGDPLATLPALANALKRREMEIAVAHPADLPTDAGRLRDHDAVLLFNVPKSAFSLAQVRALRTYIEEMSGGLVMVGLGGDLAHEVATPSPLDALLPVQFEPKGLQEAKRRVCVILLIDRSGSMMGPRLAATKRASVELVKQLATEDLVGILAFDTQPYVISEVEPAGRASAALVDRLVKLRSSGGTDVYPALVAAQTRLDMTGASVKHVILLSDGNTPFHRQAYEALMHALQGTGTTVSTIGIGAAFINTDYMEWLAQSTGGTFYQMRTLDELPQLVARDTQKTMSRLPFTEGYFRPERSAVSDWFTDVNVLPSLRGYFTATTRPGVRLDLTVNGGDGEDPLLARWSVGQGRVVSFTSDADARWSPEWIRWPGFDAAWAQVVRWVMRPRLTEELFVWVDEAGDVPQLVVEGALHDPQGEFLTAEGAETLPLALVQTGPWRWEASLERVPSGWYQLSLRSTLPPASYASPHAEVPPGKGADHATLFAKRWVQVGTPPTMDETTGQPPNATLLRRIARSTSGVYDMPDGALLPTTSTVTVTKPLLAWWLPLALLFLLIDVALRGSTMV